MVDALWFSGKAMQIYYINLDRSPDRYAFMETQLEQLGLSATRIAAVDAETAALPVGPAWRGFRPTEIACFLSHLECWKQIAAGPHDVGVVLEDDVAVAGSAGTLLKADWHMPAGVDVLKLETTRQMVRASVKADLPNTEFAYRRLYSFHLGAAAYALSRAAAARLVRLTDSSQLEPADIFIFSPNGPFSRNAVMAQLDPAICIQARLLGDERFPTTIVYSSCVARQVDRRERITRELYKLAARTADWLQRDRRETVSIPYNEG